MRKSIILFIFAIVVIPALFADAKLGVSMTMSHDMKEVERFSIESSDREIVRFGDDEKKINFAILVEGTGGVSFCNYDDTESVHLDVSVALLPGFSVRFNDFILMNVCVGPKYSRIGHSGDLDSAEGWDRFLSFMTVGLMGSHPLRKVELDLDLSFQIAFLTFGVTAGVPVFQSHDGDFSQGLSFSTYGAIDFNF